MAFQGVERRQFGRRIEHKPAVIVQRSAAGQRLPGVVVDISQGGARIETIDAARVESEFRLVLPADDAVYDCRVVHRQVNAVGVSFVRKPRKLSELRARGEPV